MSHIKSDHLLNVAVEAALAAADIIMNSLDTPHIVQHKGATDLVTKTDLESEKIIKSIIHLYFPDHDILAEESSQNINGSDYLWVIDPLDGTTNFVHGYPSFSVSIGLLYQDKPHVGVVVEMPYKKLYSAIVNKGAWCEGIEINCSKIDSIQDSLFVTGFGYNHDDMWERGMLLFKHFTNISQGVRRLGSAAIDLCHVATGQVDAFWEYGLRPWDTAAGVLIAKESGCKVTDIKGEKYNIYKNNILVTNSHIHEIMLKEISDYLN